MELLGVPNPLDILTGNTPQQATHAVEQAGASVAGQGPGAAVPQSIRERFQAQAYARMGVGNAQEFQNMDPRLRNTMITGAYADMYMSDPDTMKWAGMGAYASDLVGMGIAATEGAGLSPELTGGMNLAGVDNDRLHASLSRGNAGVYDDLYWQHLAMQQGGIETIRAAAEAGEIPATQLAGWETVAAARTQLDEARASGDQAAIEAAQSEIWRGNHQLLAHEQQIFLQGLVYDNSPEERALFERISPGMISPIPGGEGFQNYRDRTGASGGSDIGDRDQRWDWIENSMAPAYRDRETNQNGSMMRDMRRFSANQNSGVPALPVNTQDPLDFELPTLPDIPGAERVRQTVQGVRDRLPSLPSLSDVPLIGGPLTQVVPANPLAGMF